MRKIKKGMGSGGRLDDGGGERVLRGNIFLLLFLLHPKNKERKSNSSFSLTNFFASFPFFKTNNPLNLISFSLLSYAQEIKIVTKYIFLLFLLTKPFFPLRRGASFLSSGKQIRTTKDEKVFSWSFFSSTRKLWSIVESIKQRRRFGSMYTQETLGCHACSIIILSHHLLIYCKHFSSHLSSSLRFSSHRHLSRTSSSSKFNYSLLKL